MCVETLLRRHLDEGGADEGKTTRMRIMYRENLEL